MNDNETIKVLEEHLQRCDNIKHGAKKKILVDADFLKNILYIFNRQKAKIKELEGENLVFMGGVAYFKSEAIKGFWSRLKADIEKKPSCFKASQATVDFLNGLKHRQNEILNDGDNLVKEMTEEINGIY